MKEICLSVVLEGDKSHISKVIGLLWLLTSSYWLFLSKNISNEKDSFDNLNFDNKNLLVAKIF